MREIDVDSQVYPPLLLEVVNHPDRLYVRGESKVLLEKMVAVVGSRKMSVKGEEVTRRVVKQLVDMEMVVVSGLARGVDSVAHRECLRLGGRTVAVLAHGLDWVYPRENAGLAEKIVEAGGALVSQLEEGVRPERYFFPLRNRLIVGMCLGVVVIEAEIKSGTMTTANWAAELNRKVWVVRGSPGTDLLINEGVDEWSF
ncbi:DNA-processing protein DprA [Candidatus Chazhemtobacterium aquaticus]|uniref:DNA processing protein DprA n=1 Tax=Candidatus Chazhemtobacterium aquaticus TaxID=2715735 RepID=A0A857N664_9BACT|nr:DNA-processing protein DprA [Candidatus Chazhemtobacterium aquaticus]QHO63755.1 DNA processing protein DprA [Candidatus Chazhemtobacterium aquaticus]